MKKIFISFMLTIIMAVSIQANPKIIFKKTVHNFGKIKPDTSHSASFTFYNRGTSTLIIEKLRAGWGCRGTLVSAREIPAGSRGTIEVELIADQILGKITRSILIITNDPGNRTTRLILEAQVTD